MENLKQYRKKIDSLDKEIIDLLDQRMEVSKEIGRIKAVSGINTESKSREAEILKSIEKYNNSKYIKNIYNEVFNNSKAVQEYRYFLVGKSLNYSFSPIIYEMFGLENYNLFPTTKFNDILKINFSGINITNPYKYDAFNACDQLDESAKITGVVNTIIRLDNKLIGHNTDYFGFSKLLEYHNINLVNKKVLIIGNGATSKTITKVLETKQVSEISYLVRNIKNEFEHNINDFNKFIDYEIIINATPHGTYPECEDDLLFSLDGFNKLEALIDVVYNPDKTPLLMYESVGVKKVNGLMMLVAQAAAAASLYTKIDYRNNIEEVYRKLNFSLKNIVLIGMPYSGKSRVGRELSELLNHKLIDIDLLMEANKHDLASILEVSDESTFRKLEEEYAFKFSKERGQIISTGGGIVLSEKAMRAFKKNSVIVFIDTPLEALIKRIDNSRPLVKNKEDLINLYNQRIGLYKKYCDIIITDTSDTNKIMETIYEYINN